MHANRRLISTFKSFSTYAGLAVISVGLLVLLGWIFGIQLLTSVLPGSASMKVNTALAFALAGLSLWLASHVRENQWMDGIAKACAALTALIGLLTLSEYVFNRDFGIDQLLIRATSTPGNVHPGRMSPIAALSFSLLGFALLIQNRHRNQWPRGIFSLAVLLISMLALIGGLLNLFGALGLTILPLFITATYVNILVICIALLGLLLLSDLPIHR